ncbi:MAG: RCC1 domain-containing protein [Legionellales bacterium]
MVMLNNIISLMSSGLYNKLWGWGYGSSLGIGLPSGPYSSPTHIGNDNWRNICSGYRFSLGIKKNGTLWGSGANHSGALGLSNTAYYSTFKQVGALSNWSMVAATGNGNINSFSAAVKTDGSLWTWGINTFGNLGLGNTTSYSSPKQVGSLTNWSMISLAGYLGYFHTMAIKTDGTLWGWGLNAHGQLGLNNIASYNSPKQVGSLTNWAKVSCNFKMTAAIKTDGTLWTWGSGVYGKLGRGNLTNYSSPKQLGSLTNWSTISVGGKFVTAVKTDGSLWAWGNNTSGVLGLNNTTNYSSPIQVGGLYNWEASYSYIATHAIKTNGTLWGWGISSSGSMGTIPNSSPSSPVQVASGNNWSKVAQGKSNTFSITK